MNLCNKQNENENNKERKSYNIVKSTKNYPAELTKIMETGTLIKN